MIKLFYKGLLAVIFCLCLMSAGNTACAQHFGTFGKAELVEAKIDFQGHQITGPHVKINFEIPFNGMVELRLYNNKGEKVYQNQYDKKFGENVIVLKASKFNPGETYAYTLNYKRDEVRSTLVVSPSGFYRIVCLHFFKIFNFFV